MNQKTTEYNRRQIILMQNMVDLYKNSHIGIGKFISNIDALIACIENRPSEWVDEISCWLIEIESIYAWSLDQKVDFSEEDLENLKNYVGEIEKLIIWYEKNCLPQIDD